MYFEMKKIKKKNRPGTVQRVPKINPNPDKFMK